MHTLQKRPRGRLTTEFLSETTTYGFMGVMDEQRGDSEENEVTGEEMGE